MKENLIFKKSKKQSSHLTYNLKSRKGKRIFCLFLLAGMTSFLIFLTQKPDNSFASTLDECKSGQDVYVQQACDAWYSGHDDWTTMTYEWISNDSSCSHDTVTISSSDSGMVGKYLCSMAFTGNNDARANNVTYTTDHIDTGSPYFNVDSSTTMTNQATDKNSWSTATAVPVNVNADALKGSVNPNVIGNETICAEQTMTSNLTISDGGGGHKTPSISPLCVEVENKPKPTTPKINSDQPEPVKTTDSYHYQEVFYSTTTFGPINYNFSMGIEKLFDSSNPDPKYRNLSHQLGSGITQSFDFKNSENPADFYPGEENPITTSSLAAVSAAEGAFDTLVSTLKNSVVDDLKICGKSNLEDTAQIMKSSWNVFKKFVHNYRILKQNAGEDTSTTNYDSDASADTQGDIMSTILQKLLQNAALFGQAAIYTLQDKDVQSEIGKGGNAFLNFTKCNGKIAFDNLLNSTGVMSDVMNNKPTPVISEGYVDINPGETQPITSFATIPSESITYTFYKKYTKSYTTTIEYTDGVLTDDYKTLDDITSELIGYEKTYTDNGHKIKSDTRYVRRPGNIYGTEFRTRLLSVDKNTFTGTVTPPGSGAYTEATVTNPPENLDN
ncbi:hypothetical protein IKG45_00975, partial [Candidatus Saccharibacteria bacterium]|nr:hypothetical protein [Candidatus Saccharibacteria bacterium]